jgi:hypothetical protein
LKLAAGAKIRSRRALLPLLKALMKLTTSWRLSAAEQLRAPVPVAAGAPLRARTIRAANAAGFVPGA